MPRAAAFSSPSVTSRLRGLISISGTDEPLARRESDTDEPLARRESDTDEPLARRESDTDEPLRQRESATAQVCPGVRARKPKARPDPPYPSGVLATVKV